MILRRSTPAWAALAAVSLTAGHAQAAFTSPGWTRPADAGEAAAAWTTYEFWDAAPLLEGGAYTSTSVTNAPTTSVNPNGSGLAGDANDANSGSFLTSSGSIYSMSETDFIQPRAIIQSYDRGDAFATQFLIQISTFGNLLDPTSPDFLTVNGVDVTQLASFVYTELSRLEQSFSPPGGPTSTVYAVEHAWSFTLPGNADQYTIDLAWGVDSTSLGDWSIDTRVIPEPASLALLGGAMAAGVLRRPRGSRRLRRC
ncbi:MAG TPA: PEP-CTERM sorting domain-containing protein [Phycisphaeraceae bacterium]